MSGNPHIPGLYPEVDDPMDRPWEHHRPPPPKKPEAKPDDEDEAGTTRPDT